MGHVSGTDTLRCSVKCFSKERKKQCQDTFVQNVQFIQLRTAHPSSFKR